MTKASEVRGISTPETLGEGGFNGSRIATVLQKNGEAEAEEEEEEEDDEVVEAAPIRRPRNPADPTPAEREEHNATHRPFRPWCPVCVKAGGREDAHYSTTKQEKEEGMSIVSIDYASVGHVQMLIGRDK